MFPTNASHLTSWSDIAKALDPDSNASVAALKRSRALVTFMNPPRVHTDAV
jgi:hypothetical protein